MKSLSQFLKEALEEDIIKNLEVIYKVAKTDNLIIQVPDNYNEDNILMYLDDSTAEDMPHNEDSAVELFGEENTNNISDVYFEYDDLTVPEDATTKPDLKFDKRFDNSPDKNAQLTIYSLNNLKYIIKFDEFKLNNPKNLEVGTILEDLFKNAESNKLHPWTIEIVLDKINFKK